MPADAVGDGRTDLILPAWRDRNENAGHLHFQMELMVHVALSDGHGGFRWAQPNFLSAGGITETLDDTWGPNCPVGDFSGDRRADLACASQGHDGTQLIGYGLARADGSMQLARTVGLPIDPRPTDTVRAPPTSSMAIGDVTTDGLVDLMIVTPPADDVCPPEQRTTCALRYDLVRGLSTGVDFTLVRTSLPWQREAGERRRAVFAADANGDGRADYVTLRGLALLQNVQKLTGTDVAIAGETGRADLRAQCRSGSFPGHDRRSGFATATDPSR